MPTYVYQCDACKESLLIIRSIADKEIKPDCAQCSKPMMRDYRVTAVAFKGNGWGKQAR
jgi:putative FmdB family regulatory protein